MAALAEPVFVPAGPMLDWFGEVFLALPWIIPASEFAPGIPHRDMPPRVLERFVIAQASYAERDQVWAGIITRARQPPARTAYQLLAIGVAAKGLRRYRNHVHAGSNAERADLDADLIHGLLRRLATIDISAGNLGGKLIDSATGYAQRRWRSHLGRPHPADPDHAAASTERGSLQTALSRLFARVATAGHPLDLVDAELIAATRLDGHTMIDTAARLGLPLEAAYKRRQRAENRLRALTRHGTRRAEPSPAGPTD